MTSRSAPLAVHSVRSSGRDRRLYWTANTADALGSHASGLVLPLLLLGLGYSPAVAGAVAGAAVGAGLLCGPLAAVLADRGSRKATMLIAAVVAGGAMAAVAAMIALGVVSLPAVIAAVVTEQVASACYVAAAAGTVALVSAPVDYPRTVARLQAGEQGALVLGPALGGLLFGYLRWLPFLVDALSYAVAAVCVRAIRSDLRAPAEQTARPGPRRWSGVGAEAVAGLALVRRVPVLRLALLWTSTVNGVLAVLYLGVVFALTAHGADAVSVGLVLTISGAAGLVGSLAAPALARRLGLRGVLVSVTWLTVPLAVLFVPATAAWQFWVLFGAVCMLMPVAAVVLQSRAVHVTPLDLQARTGTVLAAVAGLSAAAGSVLAGVSVTWFGAPATAGACALLLCLLALHTSWATGRLGRGPG